MGKALDGLLERSGGLLGATPQERPLAYYRRTPFIQSIGDQTTGKWLLGMGREPSMPWNNPDPVKAFLGTGSLPAKGLAWLVEAMIRPMESAGKGLLESTTGGPPVDPDRITDAALASMGLGYGVTGLLGGVPKGALGANVWHGGPNRWMPEPGYPQGRPRLDRVGTGEGAQAYGHGFYSAESKGVGESYIGAGLPSPRQSVLDATYVLRGEIPLEKAHNIKATQAAMEVIERDAGLMDKMARGNKEPRLMGELVETVQSQIKQGHLKKLDLPDEDVAKYLDWDAPLSGQPKEVGRLVEKMKLTSAQKGQLTKQINKLEKRLASRRMKSLGSHVRDPLRKELRELKAIRNDATSGQELYKQIAADLGSDKAASEALRKAGIPGLKYYDQMSRGSGKGTRNYVTWDQDVLNRTKILESDGKSLLGGNGTGLLD